MDAARDDIGGGGERLTREEAFGLVRRAVEILTGGADTPVLASDVRRKARDLLGRDSESLNERMFVRVLRDAHDANVVDLRKRGDDWELAPAADVASIADQLQAAAPASQESHGGRAAAAAASVRRGMGMRGARGSGAKELPPELLTIGMVDFGAQVAPDESADEPLGAEDSAASADEAAPEEAAAPAAKKTTRRGGRGRKTAGQRKTAASANADAGADGGATTTRTKRARGTRTRAKKSAASGGEG